MSRIRSPVSSGVGEAFGAVAFGVAPGVAPGVAEVLGVAIPVLDSWFAGVDAAFGTAVEAASEGGEAGIVCVRAALLRQTATAGARRKR